MVESELNGEQDEDSQDHRFLSEPKSMWILGGRILSQKVLFKDLFLRFGPLPWPWIHRLVAFVYSEKIYISRKYISVCGN